MNYKLPLVFNKELKRNSSCNHYEIFNKEDKSLFSKVNGACHAYIKGSVHLVNPSNYILLYIECETVPYSLKDFKRWLKFLKLVGFKTNYLGIKVINKQLRYEGNLNNSCYIIRLNVSDYKSTLHIFAAITALRYIYYKYSSFFTQIPERVFELKNIYGKALGNLEAISLAYYTLGEFEENHAFIADAEKVSLITLTLFNQRIVKGEDLNYALSERKYAHERAYIINDLYQMKDYKALAKTIEIKYTE